MVKGKLQSNYNIPRGSEELVHFKSRRESPYFSSPSG